jgi:hypothetical protein
LAQVAEPKPQRDVPPAARDAGEVPPVLRRPVPGPAFRVVKWASWIELGLFAALLFFWLAPGFEHETFIFGMAHGLGYIALCLLILYALLKREAPWPLFAATLTPAGPVGSVIGIELIERRGWGIAPADGPEAAKTPPEGPAEGNATSGRSAEGSSSVAGIDTALEKSG